MAYFRQSSSSRTAGAAALSRYEHQTREPRKRPVTGSSMLSEARKELERENKSAQVETDRIADKVAKKLISDITPASAVGAARVIPDCPITAGAARIILDCPITGMSLQLYAVRYNSMYNINNNDNMLNELYVVRLVF